MIKLFISIEKQLGYLRQNILVQQIVHLLKNSKFSKKFRST